MAMLKKKPEARWTARMLCDRVAAVNNDPDVSFSYIGRCCTEDDDSAESVLYRLITQHLIKPSMSALSHYRKVQNRRPRTKKDVDEWYKLISLGLEQTNTTR
jgi:hypothetical protein